MNLKESLETINDSRIDRCKKHSLVDILMIVFFGALCGYKSIEGDVLAFDGKTECGSEYRALTENGTGHKAVHMVSAWASRLGVCFGQIKTEEKSRRKNQTMYSRSRGIRKKYMTT